MQDVCVEDWGLPIDGEVCFSSAKGKFKKGIQKRQLKILGKLMPFFGFFLVVEKLFSVYQARQYINEYIPEERIA